MEIKTLIETSAEVTMILTLRPGNVYKRIDDSGSYETEKLRYGIITDVMNNGTDTAVVAVEYYEAGYPAGAKVVRKVFTGDKPAAIFPATAEDFAGFLGDVIGVAQRELAEKQRAADAAAIVLAEVEKAQRLGITTTETVGAK